MAKKVKQKSHSGASKRFKRTGTGRIKHRRSNRNHILTKQQKKRKLHARSMGLIAPADELAVDRMLGDR